jgi:hypothetical protein
VWYELARDFLDYFGYKEIVMLILLYNPFLSIQLEKLMLIPSNSANYHATENLDGGFPV